MRFCLYGLVLLFSVLCYGCIEGDEEVWIESNGSGKMKAEYRVPLMLLSKREARDLERAIEEGVGSGDGMLLLVNRVERQNGEWLIRIELETDDVMTLEGMLSEPAPGVELTKADKILAAILGKIDVEVSGMNVSLRREVNLKPLLDEYAGQRSGVVLGDSVFKYVVNLPKAATQSNAHQAGNGGKRLVWTYHPGEQKGAPMVMELTAPVPVPWWVYALGVGLVALSGYGVWRIFARARQQKTPPRLDGEGL